MAIKHFHSILHLPHQCGKYFKNNSAIDNSRYMDIAHDKGTWSKDKENELSLNNIWLF